RHQHSARVARDVIVNDRAAVVAVTSQTASPRRQLLHRSSIGRYHHEAAGCLDVLISAFAEQELANQVRFDHELAVADPLGVTLDAKNWHRLAAIERDHHGILASIAPWRDEDHRLASRRNTQADHRLPLAQMRS